MKQQQENKDKWLHVRLTEDEHKRINKFFASTTCRKLSEYARNKLLEKPLTQLYRDQSLDDFMAEMIKLRNDLNSIGNNFNQSVKKLHSMSHVAEFRIWISTYEAQRNAVINRVEIIQNHIQIFAEKWLQSSKQDRQ